MSWFKRKIKKSEDAAPDEQLWTRASLMDLGSLLGIDPAKYDGGRLSEVTYFACLKILSEAVAKLPLSLQRVTQEGGVEDAVGNPFYRAVHIRPNPYMTPSTFWEAMENSRNHFGNAYAYIKRTESGVELYPLASENVTVYIPQDMRLSDAHDIFYTYTYPETGEYVTFGSDELLHFKTSTTFGGVLGMSIRDKLKMSLDGAKDSQAVLNDMYKNNMTARAVVQYAGTQEINDKLSRQFIKGLDDYAHGRNEASKTFVPIPFGTTVTPLNLRLADQQFLELRKYTALQIASAFGIKPNQLNDYERASYANSEAQQLAFYAETMLSILKQYEEELNFKLLTAEQIAQGYRFKFNVAAVLRGDTKAQVDSLCQGISNGLYTPNEARRMLDLPSKDGGDRIYFNGSNIAVEDAGAQYGTNNSPEPAKAMLRLAESIEKAVESGIMVVKEPVFGEGHRIVDNVGGSGGGSGGGGSGGGAGSGGSSGGGSDSGEQEEAPRHSNGGAYSVDWEKVYSDEYQSKIEKLSNDEKVCKAIKTRAIWALNNRNGTDTEELYAIDFSTGEEIGRITDQHISHGVKRSKTFDRKLTEADDAGRQILLIHNHPTGMPPSPADVNELLKCKNAIGITVGHDGSIYRYTKPRQKIDDRDWDIAMQHYNHFSEKTAQERTMQDIAHRYGFSVEKL